MMLMHAYYLTIVYKSIQSDIERRYSDHEYEDIPVRTKASSLLSISM